MKAPVQLSRRRTLSRRTSGPAAAALLAPAMATALALCWPQAAAAQMGPMSYLTSAGRRGAEIVPLTWALLILSIAVIVVIAVLLLVAIFRHRDRSVPPPGTAIPVTRTGDALKWIYGGLLLTTLLLAGAVVWTLVVMTNIQKPPEEPALTIRITGHQWWWEVVYETGNPDSPGHSARIFETANEIHVPVGEPVKLELASADVIHTFWVPQITGKTDLIPGQVNVTWLQADEPGIYYGQCTEYCGRQHARIGLRLFADPPEVFAAWLDEQLQPAEPPRSEEARIGQTQFMLRCAACHAIRGTRAGGQMGPDLTHLMTRTTLAAGIIPNNPGHLSAWIANPQVIKPENHMPNLDLSGPNLDAIRTYLLSLD